MADESIPTTAATGPVSLSEASVAPHSLQGWSTVQFALNVLLPRYLRQAEDVRQQTLRVLRGV